MNAKKKAAILAQVQRARSRLSSDMSSAELSAAYSLYVGFQHGFALNGDRRHRGLSNLLSDIHRRLEAIDPVAAQRVRTFERASWKVIQRMVKAGTIPTKTRTPKRSLR